MGKTQHRAELDSSLVDTSDAGQWQSLKPKPPTELLKRITQDLGFSGMTPIQAAAIPLLLSHKDIAAQAVTGSGKTLAFLVPLIVMVQKAMTAAISGGSKVQKTAVFGLVISPTRELAKQIYDVCCQLLGLNPSDIKSRHHDKKTPTVQLFTGGKDFKAAAKEYFQYGANIMIATPGRVEQFVDNVQNFDVRKLEILVLDEADRLLDLGFEASLNTVLEKLPKQRRTGLFSATQTDEVEQLIRAGLRNPVKVTVKIQGSAAKDDSTGVNDIVAESNGQSATPTNLENYYVLTSEEKKLACLLDILEHHKEDKVLIFFCTCASVDYFLRILPKLLKVRGKDKYIYGMHSKMVQKRRNLSFDAFRAATGKCILLCTDVAARGIDIADIGLVVQFDPPQDPESFIHRSGRTARIGRSGTAIALMHNHEDTYVDFMKNRKVPLRALPKSYGCRPRDMSEELRELALQDRDIMDKAVLAFISFLRSYKEHRLSLIFRIKDLNVGKAANAFGLLRLPKMKELQGLSTKSFVGGPKDLDLDSIPYANAEREKKRLAERNAEAKKNQKKEHQKSRKRKAEATAWSKKKSRRQQEKERQQMEVERAAFEAKESEDFATLAREAALVKKLKAGKITQAEFDRRMGDL
eukprot:Clim_evm9s149 gene=Clim_evmTU9s149